MVSEIARRDRIALYCELDGKEGEKRMLRERLPQGRKIPSEANCGSDKEGREKYGKETPKP